MRIKSRAEMHVEEIENGPRKMNLEHDKGGTYEKCFRSFGIYLSMI
jgi:hypothetical protein